LHKKSRFGAIWVFFLWKPNILRALANIRRALLRGLGKINCYSVQLQFQSQLIFNFRFPHLTPFYIYLLIPKGGNGFMPPALVWLNSRYWGGKKFKKEFGFFRKVY
jgi:hypothetical protein